MVIAAAVYFLAILGPIAIPFQCSFGQPILICETASRVMIQFNDILAIGAARDLPFDIVLTKLTKIPTLDQVILFWKDNELLQIEFTVSEVLQNHSCDATTHEVLLVH